MTTATLPTSATTPADPRLVAFCARSGAEVFHSIVNHSEVWEPDPFDVPTIHVTARDTYERLLNRASVTPPSHGKVLLLLGEAGSGKTHLMRAFRNLTHAGGRGYCGYLQMTSQASNYARYLLVNLIDALDLPYDPPCGPTSGLARLSTGLLDVLPGLEARQRQELQEGGASDLTGLVHRCADEAATDDRFSRCDLELMRAMLFLQRDDVRIKNRVLMWLRCQDLSLADRVLIGDLVPRPQEEDALKTVVALGRLMFAVHRVPLVLCVDQLEDMANQDAPVERFRKVMDTLLAVASALPTAVVVIACLEDYFVANKSQLAQTKLDRLERDPEPIRLTGHRSVEEIEAIISRRLQVLYEEEGLDTDTQGSTFPFRPEHLRPLANLRTRDVLDFCRRHHERCILAGAWVEPDVAVPRKPAGSPEEKPQPVPILLEQIWNDFHTGFKEIVPDDESDLARLLAWAIGACSTELPPGHHFGRPHADGRMIEVETHHPDNSVDRLLVGVCNKAAQGGGLTRQVAQVERRAGDTPVAIARCTAFPSTPRAEVSKQIGKLIGRGGRKAVVENADWRRMLALQAFKAQQSRSPDFLAWQRQGRPLTTLPSLRQILKLDALDTGRAVAAAPPAPPPPPPPPAPVGPVSTGAEPSRRERLVLGQTRSVTPSPVQIDREELKQHAAFLGGSGSGKTTAALCLLEQLLLQGVPAVLLDRKGDLCGYADPREWERPLQDPVLAERRHRLRKRLDVAVFTPGKLDGRPLAIPIVPAGVAQLPTADREETAGWAAAALGGMMGYKLTVATSRSKLAILGKAIEVLAALPGEAVTVPRLQQLIQDQDAALLNAVGSFNGRLYQKLAEDLQTLWLLNRSLLSDEGERLDIDALLGLGPHARPGRTRLSIISTRFLGGEGKADFWVAQLLLTISRWTGTSPSAALQAMFLFDEADQYLPANRQPATKAPMESLLKRARSAGVGLMLATQSPGDFDYKCRDTIRTWLVGRVKETTALNKLKPMLSERGADVSAKLAGQGQGEFYLIRERDVQSVLTPPSLIPTEQLSEERISELARASREATTLK